MNIPDESVDFATIFHVIHHAVDAESRLKDIARVMKPGGILLLKDHDVRTVVDASNVDFEHLVYDVGTTDKKLSELVEKYHEIEPMYYFNSDQIRAFLENNGFSTLFLEVGKGPTRVYRAAFEKK
jgi:ubiquinone/menaquinone biosynthesis C-methylase UbiE